MSHWYTCNLGDPLLAEAALDEIRSQVQTQRQHPGALEASAFVRHESRGRLHCEVHVYLPPAAAALAQAIGASACGKPSADGLDLLAGPPDAWTALFPGSAQARMRGAAP